jgi:polynucleotide 5'-hydroxyl-kinase GRC3/NOL9
MAISQSWQSACDGVLGENKKGVRIPSLPVEVAAESHRILICGAKSTGKSTLLRYLVNRHLSHLGSLIVLDCDVGQPELSPPGMLTLTLVEDPLLSLPHAHMKHLHLKAHFYGHVTSRNDPTAYLEMISDLVGFYRDYVEKSEGQEKIPLVVNTDGWVKGFGFEVLSTIIERVRPTHVIQLTGNSPSKAFTLEPLLPTDSKLVCAEAFESQPQTEIPSQALRSLRLATYFFEDTTIWDRADFGPMGIVDHDCEIANTLAARKPYMVAMNSVRCDVPFALSSAAVLDLLNGSIVGLGVDNAGEMYPSCIGLGIVRSIDRERMIFYILSPVPPDKIVNVTVLLKGTLELPVECVFRGVHAEALPYMACSRKVHGVGGEVMKSRQNINRTSLTRMR